MIEIDLSACLDAVYQSVCQGKQVEWIKRIILSLGHLPHYLYDPIVAYISKMADENHSVSLSRPQSVALTQMTTNCPVSMTTRAALSGLWVQISSVPDHCPLSLMPTRFSLDQISPIGARNGSARALVSRLFICDSPKLMETVAD